MWTNLHRGGNTSPRLVRAGPEPTSGIVSHGQRDRSYNYEQLLRTHTQQKEYTVHTGSILVHSSSSGVTDVVFE